MDYSPTIEWLLFKEILGNQRISIYYWRGQVAERDEAIRALQAENARLRGAAKTFLAWYESDKPNMRPVLIQAAGQFRALLQKGKE